MATYEVIPKRVLIGPNGQRASIYGAIPPGYKAITEGYTVETVRSDGSITVGLYAIRGKCTYAQALEAANRAAKVTGGKVITREGE